MTVRASQLPTRRLLLASLLLVLAAPAAHAAPVSFRNEVMAVLSRGGCNAGACHGNQNGKNGFKLSLRGEDPDLDLQALTRDTLGRRGDLLRPENSLVLQKAIGAIPHEGGKRFGIESREYSLLRDWIAAGMQPDGADVPRLQALEVTPREQVLVGGPASLTLQVVALFSDGQRRDVTRLAVYEASNSAVEVSPAGVVRRVQFGEAAVIVRYLQRQTAVRLAFVPERANYRWPQTPENNFVDRHVFAKLRQLRQIPSSLCSDSVFLRRAFLDTLGVLPTVDETRRFLADTRSDRRERLIDSLLERPEFNDFWALKWSDLLRVEEKTLDRKGVQLFHDWLRQCFSDRMPLNEMARELIASRGSTYSQPASNYYRALRDPHTRAEATAQVFLGLRLQCAKCHNHPFDAWTQTDYHSLAAFFARVDYRIVENNRKDKFDKHEFDGEQIVFMARTGEAKHPRSGEVLAPRFPGTPTPALPDDADRLRLLADWVAAPENPYFARAQVNRVWQHLLGRGIVDPNDDFRVSNPPVNAALLDALTRDFVEHRFDLRHLVRTILRSRTYQLAATPNDTNRDDESNFGRAIVRPLQAEQLLDAIAQVTETPADFPGQRPGLRAGQLPGVRFEERGKSLPESLRFLTLFGKPQRSLSCDCERSDDTTLAQAFGLITGELLNHQLVESKNRLGRLLDANAPNARIVEELYLAALCRPPTERELQKTLAVLDGAKDRRAALEDVLWGVLNAKEFLLRQ
jgi:hypothetical protein